MSKEKQIEEVCETCLHYGACLLNSEYVPSPCCKYENKKNWRKQSKVIEEYRQRVNAKMGKHTHLLGKEYVQRILREVAKEMEGEKNES